MKRLTNQRGHIHLSLALFASIALLTGAFGLPCTPKQKQSTKRFALERIYEAEVSLDTAFDIVTDLEATKINGKSVVKRNDARFIVDKIRTANKFLREVNELAGKIDPDKPTQADKDSLLEGVHNAQAILQGIRESGLINMDANSPKFKKTLNAVFNTVDGILGSVERAIVALKIPAPTPTPTPTP